MIQIKVQTMRQESDKLLNAELSAWLSENGLEPTWFAARQPEGLPTWDAGQITAQVFDHDGEGNRVYRYNSLTGGLLGYKFHVETLPCQIAPPVSLHV